MVEVSAKELRRAVDDVLLGASLETLHLEFQMRRLEIEDERDWVDAIRRLGDAERAELRRDAGGFVSEVCRRLGERHAGDLRVASVLQEWLRRNKDYAVFDALLANFEFPARPQILDEGRRLFPSSLTAHW